MLKCYLYRFPELNKLFIYSTLTIFWNTFDHTSTKDYYANPGHGRSSLLLLEIASPARCEFKVKDGDFAKIQKFLENLRSNFFFIYLSFSNIRYRPRGHFYFWNTNWVDQNVQPSFQIVRLSLANLAQHFLKLNMKKQFFLIILSKKFHKIRSRHSKTCLKITFLLKQRIQSYLALVSWVFVLKLQNKRGLSFWEW